MIQLRRFFNLKILANPPPFLLRLLLNRIFMPYFSIKMPIFYMIHCGNASKILI